ncbi:MAG: hypothetical protein ACK4YP_14630, partial [Myxococcota bacterium]
MSLSPYRPVPRWQRGLRSSAVGLSVGVHVVLAVFLVTNPGAAKKASEWVEMTVQEAKPPPPPPEAEPPPPPEPEPPKPKITPKAVKFQDTVSDPTPPPPPDAPPPPADTQPRGGGRQIQGITENSFAPSGKTGLS